MNFSIIKDINKKAAIILITTINSNITAAHGVLLYIFLV